MNISALFYQMLVLFGILLIGYIAAKAGGMTVETNKSLSLIVSSLTTPLLILSSVLSGARPLSNPDVLKLTLIAFAIHFVLIGLAKLLPRLFRAEGNQAGVYQFLLIFSNVGFIGYPVIDALFGTEYRFYATVFVLAFQLFCWTYGVSLLSGEKMRMDAKTFLKPTIVSAVLAYLIYFLDIPCPTVLYEITDKIGSMTTPLAMLIIGCSLAQLPIREIFNKWQIYVLCLIKMIVLPLLGWCILRLVLHDESLLGVTTVILAMPTATNATIISYRYGGDEKLASAGVFLTTLLSVLTIPFMMWVLFTWIPQLIG